MRRYALTAALLGAGMVFILGGCATDPDVGYTTASLYRPDISSVAVPMWSRGRDVYRRDLETRLTESIVKYIELTPYKVTSKARADTMLSGTIDKISQRVLSTNPDTGEPREKEITFSVSFVWEDLRTGEILVQKRNFRVDATYIPETPLDESFFIGSEDLVDRLAERIVEQMERPL